MVCICWWSRDPSYRKDRGIIWPGKKSVPVPEVVIKPAQPTQDERICP